MNSNSGSVFYEKLRASLNDRFKGLRVDLVKPIAISEHIHYAVRDLPLEQQTDPDFWVDFIFAAISVNLK